MKKLIISLIIIVFSLAAQAQSFCNANYTFADTFQGYQFFDQSVADSNEIVVSWLWDFGDSSTSTLQNPWHSYNNNGVYLVCLTIITSDSCTDTFCDTISTGSSCQALFSTTKNNLIVNFNDASINATAWHWNFGDSTTSNLQNPVHTYNSAGTYLVCLIIYDIDSIGDTLCVSDHCYYINVNCGVDANYSYTTSAFQASFTDSSVGVISSWYWDFGDSSTSTLQNPSHTFANAGWYYVCLTATDTAGCVSTECKYVHITCGTVANFSYTANFEVLSFTDISTNAVSWHWSFGDGDSSNVQNPTHLYTNAGWYYVCLTVADSSGCLDDYCKYIHVNCCEADFDYEVHDATVFFEDQSCSYFLNYHWDFGDGDTSNNKHPSHTYLNSGTYTVCLIGEYSDSGSVTCSDTICKNVTVYEGDTCADLSIDMGTWFFRPCLNHTYTIYYCNYGNIPATNVEVKVELDNDLTAQSSAPAWDSKVGNLITWNMDTVQPGACGHIYLINKTSCDANAGDLLCVEGWIYPIDDDCYDDNNETEDCRHVINSYDPNDKMVASREMKTNGYVAEEEIEATDTLTYQISFQNTGTAPAINIEITDKLAPYLDLSTVVPGASSHPYSKFEVTNGNLKWTFNNINLPDSNSNEPESHGFVKFTVAQKANNVPGTKILNDASIFFDFNPPVLTNTVINTIKTNVGLVNNHVKSESMISVYPNPFESSTNIYVQIDENESIDLSFTMYDLIGKEVMKITGIERNLFQINSGNLSNGLYFYKVSSGKIIIGTGKVVIEKFE